MPAVIRHLIALVAFAVSLPLHADEVIRIMAANTSSGNLQSYDPGHGNRIFQGLDPDIALVQEMNVGTSPNKNTPATYRAWVTANFGSSFSYFVEPSGNIPNGIVSRYPILAAGEWDDSTMTDRDYVWARIDIPGDKDLWAVSLHISSGGGSSRRNIEAGEIKQFIAANVPATDYLVIGGDFNTDSRGEACINTFDHTQGGVVVVSGPYPADQAGKEGTNASRAKPYDWVMPDPDLAALKTPLVVGSQTFANGLVFDSRVFTPLSDVSPVLSSDSGASGMQHMAVMRAFLIPVNTAPTIVSAANSSSTEVVTDPDSSVYEIVRGASVGLSVAAADNGGESALKYTWSLASGPGNPVTFSANGTNAAKNTTATFQATGDYTFNVTVQDVPGLFATSLVKARVVQAATSLALNPAGTTLAVNAPQTFTASLRDQFSQAMSVQPQFIWSADGGGNIDASGIFTATTAGGPYNVTAAGGGFSSSSSITVTRASATINLTDLTQTYDGNPKPVTITTAPAGLAVSILYDGSPTPPTNAGSYPVVVSITDSNYQGSASGTLIIEADPWTLWKNTHFTSSEQSAGLADDLADPDADGWSNLAEYALGSHPRTFTPPLPFVLNEAGLSITFTRPAGLPGIRYHAEASSDLVIWTQLTLEVIETGPVETLRASDPPGDEPAAPHFLRLKFERE